MDSVVYQKAKNIKDEVAGLCVNLRAVYMLFTSKQFDITAYANSTLQKAQAKNVNKSIIKSVQRGTATKNGTITISAVDMSKCILLVDGRFVIERGTSTVFNFDTVTISFNSSTEIAIAGIGSSSTNGGWANWQVIEFY